MVLPRNSEVRWEKSYSYLGNAAVSGRQETGKENGRMIAAEIVEDGK